MRFYEKRFSLANKMQRPSPYQQTLSTLSSWFGDEFKLITPGTYAIPYDEAKYDSVLSHHINPNAWGMFPVVNNMIEINPYALQQMMMGVNAITIKGPDDTIPISPSFFMKFDYIMNSYYSSGPLSYINGEIRSTLRIRKGLVPDLFPPQFDGLYTVSSPGSHVPGYSDFEIAI